MAEREDKFHTNRVRKRIQTSQLITRLEMNALGDLEPAMTTEQSRSAEIVLRKAMPDLKATDYQPDDEGQLRPLAWDK